MKKLDGNRRSDWLYELDSLILDLMLEKKIINADRIKNILNKRYSRKLGWITIKRHIDRLLEQKLIKIFYENDEGKKKVILYALR